jgi:hypothetical protein
MAYKPKVGGYLHIQTLTDMRSKDHDLVQRLTNLSRAAGNDATRAEVLECLVIALQFREDIGTLLEIYKGDET